MNKKVTCLIKKSTFYLRYSCLVLAWMVWIKLQIFLCIVGFVFYIIFYKDMVKQGKITEDEQVNIFSIFKDSVFYLIWSKIGL